ncbi:MAG: metallophosphoesterase [Bradymonadales bacterium]|nr:metallophosphoesterase [Bradymonadales bacterium]
MTGTQRKKSWLAAAVLGFLLAGMLAFGQGSPDLLGAGDGTGDGVESTTTPIGQDAEELEEADRPLAPSAESPLPEGSGWQGEVRPEGPLRIAVISDLNERYGDQFHRETVHAAVGSLNDLSPDLVIILGDMVAGQRVGLDYLGMWAAFHAAVTEPLSRFPLAVLPGNHDASSYSRYAQERQIYRDQWLSRPVPWDHPGIEVVDGQAYPFRYSFTLGPVLILALDTTHRNSLDDDGQIEWLEEQLTSEAAGLHPVRILAAHLPLYPFAQGRHEDYLLADPDLRRRIEALLADHPVSLVISGHHHAYFPGVAVDTGIRMLGMGCLGGGPRVLLGDDRQIADTDDPTERSFTLIEVAQDRILTVEAYRGPGFGPTDRVWRSSLPERVGLETMLIQRDDLR